MRELTVFIDESGDWGEYDYTCPFYIVTMVFHDQSEDISNELSSLDERMRFIGCDNHCVHAGPIIRGEYEYRDYEPEVRRK